MLLCWVHIYLQLLHLLFGLIPCSCVRCICFYNSYIFFLGWSLGPLAWSPENDLLTLCNVLLCLLSGLSFKVYFVWSNCCHPSFLLISILVLIWLAIGLCLVFSVAVDASLLLCPCLCLSCFRASLRTFFSRIYVSKLFQLQATVIITRILMIWW